MSATAAAAAAGMPPPCDVPRTASARPASAVQLAAALPAALLSHTSAAAGCSWGCPAGSSAHLAQLLLHAPGRAIDTQQGSDSRQQIEYTTVGTAIHNREGNG